MKEISEKEKLEQERQKNLLELKYFFLIDKDIKKRMIAMAPKRYIDEQSVCDYSDKIAENLQEIFNELKDSIKGLYGIKSYEYKKVDEMALELFSKLIDCGLDLNLLNKFYTEFVSDMSIDFRDSVKKECVGYSFRMGNSLEKAKTINELLHYFHASLMNDEYRLEALPTLAEKTNDYMGKISYRGFEVPIFEEIYTLFPKNLNVGDTDMVVVDNNKLIMMIRDLGHALTIEITINSDIARVEYFIPKICNANKVNKLPGVEKVSEDSNILDSTTGITEFPISDLPQQLFDFLAKVPTDEDIEIIRHHW